MNGATVSLGLEQLEAIRRNPALQRAMDDAHRYIDRNIDTLRVISRAVEPAVEAAMAAAERAGVGGRHPLDRYIEREQMHYREMQRTFEPVGDTIARIGVGGLSGAGYAAQLAQRGDLEGITAASRYGAAHAAELAGLGYRASLAAPDGLLGAAYAAEIAGLSRTGITAADDLSARARQAAFRRAERNERASASRPATPKLMPEATAPALPTAEMPTTAVPTVVPTRSPVTIQVSPAQLPFEPCTPPRLARWALGYLFRPEKRDRILEGLDEAFPDKVMELGRLRARGWYWAQVISADGPPVSNRFLQAAVTLGRIAWGAFRYLTGAP